jgi:hypothetical protein
MNKTCSGINATRGCQEDVLDLYGIEVITDKIEDQINDYLNSRLDALGAVITIGRLNNVRKKVFAEICNRKSPFLPCLEEFRKQVEDNHKALFDQYKHLLFD